MTLLQKEKAMPEQNGMRRFIEPKISIDAQSDPAGGGAPAAIIWFAWQRVACARMTHRTRALIAKPMPADSTTKITVAPVPLRASGKVAELRCIHQHGIAIFVSGG